MTTTGGFLPLDRMSLEGSMYLPHRKGDPMVARWQRKKSAHLINSARSRVGHALLTPSSGKSVNHLGVQRSYFAHSAALVGEDSARVNRDLGRKLLESIQEKMSAGLATEPEKLLAERALAQAEYDLESARQSVKTTLGELRTAAGVAANAPLRVKPLPMAAPDSFAALQDKLDSLVDAALVNRPDLAGRVADLRAQEAATRRAKADFFPEIRFEGTYHSLRNLRFPRQGSSDESQRHLLRQPKPIRSFPCSGLGFVRRIRAGREGETTPGRGGGGQGGIGNPATRHDPGRVVFILPVITSRRRVQFAQAALSSSQENFDASKAFFEDGLATITELVSAQNELAAAHSERIRATADYLTGIASLTLAIGKPVTTASKESSSSEYPPAAMGRRDARAVPQAK